MQRFINYITTLLSLKWTTAAILFVSIASRITHLIFFFNIRVDRSYQLLATQNFIHGDGITTAQVLPGDLSAIIYTPLIKWPPGYSMLLSPFYWLSGNNYLLSALFLDILFGIILIFVSRAILKILNTPLYLVNIYTLTTSFFIYYFYFITSSDAIATTFFIIALYYTLLFLKTSLYWSKAVMLITLFLVSCEFMKYLFIPVVFTIPLFLAVKGFIDRNKKMLKTGILSFLVLTCAIIILLLYQKNIGGASTYVSDAARGFFPENLLSAYPLIPGALIKPDTVALLLNKPGTEAAILYAFQLVYVFFIAVAIIGAIWLLYKYKLKKITLPFDFFCLTACISLITILLLAALSVRVAKAEEMPGNWWTFIQEPRYYGLPNVLIHISIFVLYHTYRNKIKKSFKYLLYCLILLMLPEMFRGIIFTAKRVINFNKEEYSWQSDLRIQKYASAIIKKEKQKYPLAKEAVIGGTSYYINNRISLYSHIPILEQTKESFGYIRLQSKKAVLLLLVVQENDKSSLQYYPAFKNQEAAGNLNGFFFYATQVGPDE